MNINEITDFVYSCVGKKDALLDDIDTMTQRLNTAKVELERIETAQTVAIQAAQDTQAQLSNRITEIVQCALETVFPLSDYEFSLVFGQRAGKSQIDLVLSDNGQPINDFGGGLRDIISFALRLAVLTLGTSDKVLILDEPMKFLSADLRKCGAQLLRELSHKLGIQIICVTHIPEIVEVADKSFTVTKVSDKSEVV